MLSSEILFSKEDIYLGVIYSDISNALFLLGGICLLLFYVFLLVDRPRTEQQKQILEEYQQGKKDNKSAKELAPLYRKMHMKDKFITTKLSLHVFYFIYGFFLLLTFAAIFVSLSKLKNIEIKKEQVILSRWYLKTEIIPKEKIAGLKYSRYKLNMPKQKSGKKRIEPEYRCLLDFVFHNENDAMEFKKKNISLIVDLSTCERLKKLEDENK